MTAARLREAATLMRERAEAASPGRRGYDMWNHDDGKWSVTTHDESMHDVAVYEGANVPPPEMDEGPDFDVEWRVQRKSQARHDAIFDASWHPAVALAVADWLDCTADDFDQWHGVRSACRELDANDGETPEGFRCDCSFKDCYEHGKWHNCVHGMPNTDAALAVADAYLGGEQR